MTGAPAIALQTRGDWLAMLQRICAPVLAHGAAGTLKAAMPFEAPAGGEARRACTYLEACARTLAGMAPWLELDGLDGEEAAMQARARGQTQALLASIADPDSPDHIDFGAGPQSLVDAAFLAQAILRAPNRLWNELPGAVRARLVGQFAATRAVAPPPGNWLLFSAMVETFFAAIEHPFDRSRIDHAVRQFDGWYVGDGWYSDGPIFQFNYYNSFVIHPFLIDILRVMRGEFAGRQIIRAQRHAAQLERMIAPDGSMPAIGRSLCYRCGNLHLLAQLALLRRLPLAPGQVRGAMARAMARGLLAPGSFDPAGWLVIGHAGHQPALAEDYISTGSLYLCTAAFLPLGLAPADPFWTEAAPPPTTGRLYGGGDLPPDHAIAD